MLMGSDFTSALATGALIKTRAYCRTLATLPLIGRRDVGCIAFAELAKLLRRSLRRISDQIARKLRRNASLSNRASCKNQASRQDNALGVMRQSCADLTEIGPVVR